MKKNHRLEQIIDTRGGCPVCGKVILEADDLAFQREFGDHLELHNKEKGLLA
ncbi:MAG: hypothetical protein ACREBS_07480 [Nitrososphaerales archaeon]